MRKKQRKTITEYHICHPDADEYSFCHDVFTNKRAANSCKAEFNRKHPGHYVVKVEVEVNKGEYE